MFAKFFLSKRLNRIFKVVEFKGINPMSKIYGTFKVKVSEDEEHITYKFLDCRITEERKSGELALYQGSTLQMTSSKYWIKLHNDAQYLQILMDRIDKNIYYYVE